MASRIIVLEGDERLRKKSRAVTVFDQKLGELIDDMAQTMYEAGNGAGLAAPQVGILRRVVVVDVGEGLIELVNPQILKQTGSQTGTEGCLSCPGQWGVVERPKKVWIKAADRTGKPFEIVGEDFLARAFCHEIDHLEGRLYKDIAQRMLEAGEEAFENEDEKV